MTTRLSHKRINRRHALAIAIAAGGSGLLPSTVMAHHSRFYAKRYKGKRAPKLKISRWIKNEVPLTGKPMLIKFFATWCSVCRQSVSPLNKLQKEFEGKLRIVAMSDQSRGTVESFADRKINYGICLDNKSKTFKKYGLEGVFPHFVMVSSKGYVRYEGPLPVHDYDKLKKRIGKYV